VLKGFAAQGDELYRVRVRARARTCATRSATRWPSRGRAFSTAHQIEVLRTAATAAARSSSTARSTSATGPAERLLAPPLVVEVERRDLHAAGLAEYLDGAQKIVLVVDGPRRRRRWPG
jgi:hypothetical protein